MDAATDGWEGAYALLLRVLDEAHAAGAVVCLSWSLPDGTALSACGVPSRRSLGPGGPADQVALIEPETGRIAGMAALGAITELWRPDGADPPGDPPD